ncbi:Syntaxin-binding protein 2 [Bienertia sinuspersici]
MDRRCFDNLCHVLVTRRGLVTTRNVTVLEVVAFFLHTLAHDPKNRTIDLIFTHSRETVMNNKHKEPMASTQVIQRGYMSWNKQMDDILTRVLLEEINTKEKGDGGFKLQAYQAVVDDLKKELGIAINVDHVRNRTKSWKKYCGCIMDIRTYTKFKWNDKKKMIIITMEDENKNASPYRNKAIGDASEQHDKATDVMEEEIISEGRSSSKDPTNSGSRKRKKDSLADAVNSFTESFKEYVQSKIKDTPRPTCQEIHAVVSQVFGISRSQIMRAVKRFMIGNPDEFLMLKELLENENLEWVFLFLAE